MKTDREVIVKISYQGDAVPGNRGYMLVGGSDCVAFYVDGWGATCRIYPVSYSSTVYIHESKELKNFPSITLENGDEDSTLTDIYFPEYEGWDVHSVGGGKTMSVCLVKH